MLNKKMIVVLFVSLLIFGSLHGFSQELFFDENIKDDEMFMSDLNHDFSFNVDYDPGDMDTSFFDSYDLASFGQTVWGLASADFNNDNLLDFAVSSATVPFSYASITIFYNQGDLSFIQEEIYRYDANYIMDLAVADVDTEGFLFDDGVNTIDHGGVDTIYDSASNISTDYIIDDKS